MKWSLHICTAESDPINAYTGPVKPTRQDRPTEGQPDATEKFTQTSALGVRGAKTLRKAVRIVDGSSLVRGVNRPKWNQDRKETANMKNKHKSLDER